MRRFAAPILIATLFAAPALAGEADPNAKGAEKTEEAGKAEPEKVCKFIRADVSSRRKERICLTPEQWVEANRGAR